MSGGQAGRGRKPLPPAARAVVHSLRLTAAQWARLQALGGVAWLRGALARARGAR